MEKYCLRILLLHRKCCQSYSDIKTVIGVEYCTFKATVEALALKDDNKEWNHALTDACEVKTNSNALRTLFVNIILQCQPSNPLNLWEQFKEHLSEDILHIYRNKTNNKYLIVSQDMLNLFLFRI